MFRNAAEHSRNLEARSEPGGRDLDVRSIQCCQQRCSVTPPRTEALDPDAEATLVKADPPLSPIVLLEKKSEVVEVLGVHFRNPIWTGRTPTWPYPRRCDGNPGANQLRDRLSEAGVSGHQDNSSISCPIKSVPSGKLALNILNSYASTNERHQSTFSDTSRQEQQGVLQGFRNTGAMHPSLAENEALALQKGDARGPSTR